jgi:hypothetical protein
MKSYGILFMFLAVLAAGCAPLVLKPADFAWPIEDELKSDSHGIIHVNRYSLSFSINPLMYAELKDSVHVADRSIRIICGTRGHYYLTAPKFKNVYVFSQGDGGLVLKKKILVSKQGLASPAFNQRAPYIELIDGNEKPVYLNAEGIREEGGK